MKRKIVAYLCVLGVLSVTACGKNDITVSDTAQIKESESADEGARELTEESSDAEVNNLTEKNQDAQVRGLTEDEIQFFTEYAQKMENYGFFMSSYESVQDVDLNMIFYSGAGISEPMTDEDVAEYLAAAGQEEMYTDCVKISRSKADDLLERKTVFSLDQMNTSLNWTYISKFDAFYQEAGDTNYMRYICLRGTKEGDLYTLQMTPDSELGYGLNDCVAVLKQNGDDYIFVSNRFLQEDISDSEDTDVASVVYHSHFA